MYMAEADYTSVTTRIKNQTYTNILKLAEKENIVQVVTVHQLGTMRMRHNVPNISQTISRILEQYFVEHPV